MARSLPVVLLAMLLGLIAGIPIGGQWFRKPPPPDELGEEEREEWIDDLFQKYSQGEIEHVTYLPAMESDIPVKIIDSIRGAECGFNRNEARRMYLNRPGCYRLFQYNGDVAFVVIKYPFANSLRRGAPSDP